MDERQCQRGNRAVETASGVLDYYNDLATKGTMPLADAQQKGIGYH